MYGNTIIEPFINVWITTKKWFTTVNSTKNALPVDVVWVSVCLLVWKMKIIIEIPLYCHWLQGKWQGKSCSDFVIEKLMTTGKTGAFFLLFAKKPDLINRNRSLSVFLGMKQFRFGQQLLVGCKHQVVEFFSLCRVLSPFTVHHVYNSFVFYM